MVTRTECKCYKSWQRKIDIRWSVGIWRRGSGPRTTTCLVFHALSFQCQKTPSVQPRFSIFFLTLIQWFSKPGPQPATITTTCELVRNANLWLHSRPTESKKSGGGAHQPVLMGPAGGFDAGSILRITSWALLGTSSPYGEETFSEVHQSL